MFPSGTIIDSLDMVDAGQHDKLIVISDTAKVVENQKVVMDEDEADEDEDLDPE